MNTAITTRLPGIYFPASLRKPATVLPRMDIAAFVGLASSGPLDTPVPVEEYGQFVDIFGADLPVAWDSVGRRTQYAFLSNAVETFFLNGGRRCWVVRVAYRGDGQSAGGAQSNTFPLAQPGDILPVGLLRADTLTGAVARARSEGTWSDALQVGTVLQAQSMGAATVTLLPQGIYRIVLSGGVGGPIVGDLLRLTCGDSGLLLYAVPDQVQILSQSGQAPSWQADCSLAYWFQQHPLSPPTGAAAYQPLTDPDGPDQYAAWQAGSSPLAARAPIAERLTFDLWVWQNQQVTAGITGLAFHEAHPRFWATLPLDTDLFALSDGRPAPAAPGPLVAEAAVPRFPVAGPEGRAPLYLPLGMGAAPDISTAQWPLDVGGTATAQQRDGLEVFGAQLFIDPNLADADVEALPAEANSLYYLSDPPVALRGMHSLLPVDEVTLIAAPDAVQPGWRLSDPIPPVLLSAPVLAPISHTAGETTYAVSWSPVVGATAYTLEASGDPQLATVSASYTQSATTLQIAVPSDCPQGLYYHVRAEQGSQVSAWSNTVRTVVPQPDFIACGVGMLAPPVLALISTTSPPGAGYLLSWSPAPGAAGYTLQQAADPGFLTATSVPVGAATSYAPPEYRNDGVYYYRVSAYQGSIAGPWSNTEIYNSTPAQVWTLNTPAGCCNGDLLQVHQALLRFCAARGDMLAALSLPIAYREQEVLAHTAALTALFAGASPAEARALSYGALYHPWIAGQPTPGTASAATISYMPPDGPLCGLMAARANAVGAWIAPANLLLENVVAVEPVIDMAGWASLFPAQVNVIMQGPRGFLPMSASTLSRDTDLLPINVRRLMILLRRLALREGPQYVFQPNDARFRRAVERQFESLLSGLFASGAFAGSTTGQAFQVVTDDSVNTPQSVDLGRLIIELRVAPSRPMAFLTVRLVQQGSQQLTVQESAQ